MSSQDYIGIFAIVFVAAFFFWFLLHERRQEPKKKCSDATGSSDHVPIYVTKEQLESKAKVEIRLDGYSEVISVTLQRHMNGKTVRLRGALDNGDRDLFLKINVIEGPPKAPARSDSNRDAQLEKALLSNVAFGDRGKMERLIAFEKSLCPNLDRIACIRSALDRHRGETRSYR